METSPSFDLELRSVSVTLGRRLILQDCSLHVPRGSIYGLLGRNGSGKSTAFKLMLGLLRPDAGEVLICGAPWTRTSLHRIGASVNGPALYEHLSALDNLRIHQALTGVSTERIHTVLETVGISSAGSQRAASFSLGMKARLALGIALLTDPPILLLDEPQNGLDPQGIVELRRLLTGLAAQGRTIVISSHQLGEIAATCTHVGVLAHGQLQYEGPLRELAPTQAPDGPLDPLRLERAYLDLTGEPEGSLT
jgi:ABC-2 type transport system ATP-binding protein